MTVVELFLIAVGVSMDAFAVSICKGLSVRKLRPRHAFSVAMWFGGFQALMPLLGYFVGIRFSDFVTEVDHWIAFALLSVIGANMIKESRDSSAECEHDSDFSFRKMLALALATSIDALAIGVSFAFLKINIWTAILLIGVTTAMFSGVGLKIGNVFGCRYKSKAEMTGGLILIIMGVRILVEHLFLS
ncbi:MAG: manganese efflux pump [Bacteroidales bacterium]|nr:manganese efflux pump [Bacteroidales bacterium]